LRAPPSPLRAAGTTNRCTAGRISRSGNSAGRAISVSRLSARMATRTMGMTAPAVTGPPNSAGAIAGTSCSLSIWVRLRVLGGEISGQPLAGEPVAVRQASGQLFDRHGDPVGGSRTKRRDPFVVERAGRADQYPARGGVHDAHPDLGGGVLSIAASSCDDLDVAAWAGEHGLNHRPRRLRDTQV